MPKNFVDRIADNIDFAISLLTNIVEKSYENEQEKNDMITTALVILQGIARQKSTDENEVKKELPMGNYKSTNFLFKIGNIDNEKLQETFDNIKIFFDEAIECRKEKGKNI